MGRGLDDHRDTGVDSVAEELAVDLTPPPMYQILMLDDDYTPMDFVVEILMLYFGMDEDKASRVMLAVHTQGKASCGSFTKDVAETKIAQVVSYAREHNHPLLCEMERV